MIHADFDLEIPEQLGRVHFVGIGGAGMNAIARMMHRAGVKVSGSDRSDSSTCQALRDIGIPVEIGHEARYAEDIDTLVVTGALREDNPTYVRARERGILVLHRSQALHWLSRHDRVISVAGAHGKTTSTGMVAHGLRHGGNDVSYVNGAAIVGMGETASAGSADTFVLEADESDKSFLLYNTAVALITNVDPEHLDFYGSRENFMQAFVDFANAATEAVVISADDPGTKEVTEQLTTDRKIITFGQSESADVRLSDLDTSARVSFTVTANGESLPVQLRLFGDYNAYNATGAIAVLLHMGYTLRQAVDALQDFQGVTSRLQFYGRVNGVEVYDDYAHHHNEIKALLGATRTVAGSGRVIAVHRPHLYSRTQLFASEFAEILEAGADHTVVLDLEAAREEFVPGVTGKLVTDKFVDQSKVALIEDWDEACEYIANFSQPGDIVVTMSVGSLYRICPMILAALEKRYGVAAELPPGGGK